LECAGYVRKPVFVVVTKQSYACKTPTITLPDALTRSAYEDRYLDLFWSAYLPNGQALSSGAVQDALGGWTNIVQELYTTDDTLKKAVLALCMANAGKLEGLNWMLEESLKLYVSALQDLAATLKRRPKTKRVTILITARLFGLYEVRTRIE
jgi:hypothetical protein